MTHQGDLGGATNSITWLTRGLAEKGHEVFLACRPESMIAARFEDGLVRVLPTRLPRGLPLLGESRRFRNWFRDNRIDLVNAHASLDRHLLSYVRLLGTKTALVHTRRNMALSSGGRLRARFDTATTDGIIAVSQEVADDQIRRGIPESHVTVIRNGLPLSELPQPDPQRVAGLRDELRLAEGAPVLGVVARRKSQDELLKAAAILGRPLEMLFVGADEDEELRRLITELPFGCRAHCLGYRDDVVHLMALFDLFVLPSEIEGFSLALIDAMARGLPCLATDVGGNAEALAEGAGVLFPPRDPGRLAEVLAGVLDDPEAAKRMGERARERAWREYDVARTVERTEALYERLVSQRAS